MVFCRFSTREFYKSMYAIFQSGLHTLFIFFNPPQMDRIKIRQKPPRLNSIFLLILLTPLAFSLLPLASTAHAASVTLAWDRSQEPDVAGYRVYYGTTSGHYTTMISVGNSTTCTISNLEPGMTYYFAVTAYDTSGNESAYSQEIPYTVPFLDSDGDGMPDDWERLYGLLCERCQPRSGW